MPGSPSVSRKGVPVAGGMAGGSADAAAALVATDRLLGLGLNRASEQRGARLGSDAVLHPRRNSSAPAGARSPRRCCTPAANNTSSWHWPPAGCPPRRCSASSTGSAPSGGPRSRRRHAARPGRRHRAARAGPGRERPRRGGRPAGQRHGARRPLTHARAAPARGPEAELGGMASAWPTCSNSSRRPRARDRRGGRDQRIRRRTRGAHHQRPGRRRPSRATPPATSTSITSAAHRPPATPQESRDGPHNLINIEQGSISPASARYSTTSPGRQRR